MRGLGDFVSESRDWLTRLATGKAKRDEETRSTVILRLTVQDVDSRDAEDIEVIASPDDSVGKLLKSISVNPETRNCFVGATALDPRARLADSPLLPGAVLSVGGAGPDYQPVRGAAAGTLHVIAGPDAGFGLALRPGRYFIGRAADSHVCLWDKDVSRMHALVEVSAEGGASISDAGSRNGTWVNGARVAELTALDDGSVVRIGNDKLRWAAGAGRELRVAQTADGRLEFDRVFAAAPAIPVRDVDAPPQDPAPRSVTAMVTTGLAGLAAGPALFLGSGSHNPLLLLGSLAGPGMGFVSYALEGHGRKKEKRAVATARTAAREQVAALVADEERVRHLLAPAPAEITAMATGARAGLWPRDTRSPYGLVLRVGVTDQAPAIRLRGSPGDGFEMPSLHGVPVTVDLRETGVLGVIGTGEPAKALLRWLIVQLATLRSPGDLRLVLLTAREGAGVDAGDADIGWARWLPHLDGGAAAEMPCLIGNTDASRAARIDELRRLITARMAEHGGGQASAQSGAGFGGDVVVVIDGALALRNLPGIRDILLLGPEAGVYVVCADSQGMAECRGVCELTADGLRLFSSPDSELVTGVPDGVDRARAEQVARALAPMQDRMPAATESAIPYPVRLLDLLGIGVPSAQDILALWSGRREGPVTRVVLGADASGPVTVDLGAQGPHTMLAGATGAGKSVLLQTLVTALLLANRPDELNLVLVDFKGGGAFLPFENCPHVTALIRSTGETAADTFDEADAARVLASVRAEMSRREAILSRFGAEIDSYWRAREIQPGLDRLPRVVMIFDEFARVLETSPDFLKELVKVAAKGRSLGVHLVLATQALQGKLSPELKNNIDLRISLRQNEPAESVEVLGAPDAVTIPGALRGRGMILFMKGESRTPRSFQSGYLGDPPPAVSGSRLTSRPLAWADVGAARPTAVARSDGGPTDQDLVIKAIEEAAGHLEVPPPFRTLLPALPACVPLERLAEYQTEPPPPSGVPFGLADLPDLQAQPAYCFDLAGTDRLMVAGGPQSGRTTFARALITSLAARFRPDQVHFYVVEHQPAGLAEYTGLPHCGGIFSSAEPDRIRRLVGWLDEETQRRAVTRFDPGRRDDPVIVVVVDGWEQFESRANPALADVSLGPTLREIMAVGAPLGMHIVAIGGQDLLTGKVPALCGQRLLLPFPNEDTRRAQLRGGVTSPPPLPGRAVDAATGRNVQVCLPQTSAADLVAGVTVTPGTKRPRRFPSLPSLIGVEELALPQPLPAPAWIPLGVGGHDLVTIGVDFFDMGPHLMLIAGPQKSGRSTAIATLARLLSWHGIDVLAIAPRQSPLGAVLTGDDGIRVITAMSFEDTALREAVEPFGDHRYAVLIDDADKIAVLAEKQGFGEAPTLLDEIARPTELGHRALIIAANAAPVISGQHSLRKAATAVMTSGTRLLLTPAKRADARELGIALEPDQYFTRPAGRGYLASAGAVTLIQLATTDA